MLDLLGISVKAAWLSVLAGSYSNVAFIYKELGFVFYMKTYFHDLSCLFKKFLL